PSDGSRPALIDASVLRRPFVTVDVENRHEEEIGPVEKRSPPPAHRELAQKHQPGILAVDLAGVNPGLNEKGRPGAALQRFRGEQSVARNDHYPDVASLRRAAEGC